MPGTSRHGIAAFLPSRPLKAIIDAKTDPEAFLLLALREQLLAAEHILKTQYSFDLAKPNYIICLRLIADMPEQRAQIINALTSMFLERAISDEPVAYLMHHLRWPEVLDWAQDQLRRRRHPVIYRRSLEKIVAAFNDQWENEEFYTASSVTPI